jgi:hypothetical protein
MKLNLGSTASENVIEIELGAGPVESGAGFITFGWACARADGTAASMSRSAGTMGRNNFVSRFMVLPRMKMLLQLWQFRQ